MEVKMVEVKKTFEIGGEIVEKEESFKGFDIYVQADSNATSQIKYITKDNKVLFRIEVASDGDAYAYISDFDIKYVGN